MANADLDLGSLAPDFKLLPDKGSEIKLSDYRGQKVVLFFVREYN